MPTFKCDHCGKEVMRSKSVLYKVACFDCKTARNRKRTKDNYATNKRAS